MVILIIRKFTVGAVSNFIGEFVAQKIYNYITDQDENERFTVSVYIATIISGGILGMFSYKVKSLLARTALIVGVNHALIDQVDRLLGGVGFNHDTFIEDFIFDTIIVYYITLIVTQILGMINRKQKNKKFDEEIIRNLPLSIAINMYFNVRYASEENAPR